MNLTKIKVCGMTDAQNMRDIAAFEPNFFGLIFYPKSPRFISVEGAKVLPHFPAIERVGVFVNEDYENLLTIAAQTDLSLIQLHGNESPGHCGLVKKMSGLKIIKAFAVDENFDGKVLKSYETSCDYFLFDTKTTNHGGSGRSFDWRILRKFEINRPFFLSGGIGTENAAEAVSACQDLPLYALDINSRAEISAGVKSPKIVQNIIQAVDLRRETRM